MGFTEKLILLGLQLLTTLLVVFAVAWAIQLDFHCDFVGIDAFCPGGLRNT